MRVDGQTVTGIDATLGKGATMSGTVSNADGMGVGAVKVTVERYEPRYDYWDDAGTAWTNADGSYTFSYLQGGTYRVNFAARGKYFGEWYDDARTKAAANLVEVPRDGTVSGIDAVLETGGMVRGRVSGDAGGLANINVVAYQADGYGSWRRVADTTVDATGQYTIDDLHGGVCRIRFGDPTGRYLPEYWDDALTLAGADDVAVEWGEITPGIDAVLTEASHIQGAVTGSGGGTANVRVEAYASDGDGGWDYVDRVSVDALGGYDLAGLRAGTYRVHFVDRSGQYAPEWWDAAARLSGADDIDLAVAETRTGVNAELGPAGQVRGAVTAEGEGPLADIRVVAYANLYGNGWDYVDDATTDADGRYTIGGLGTASYRLFFRDESPPWWAPDEDRGLYLDEWFDDAATLRDADDVPVVAGQTTDNINVALSRGGSIAGIVTLEEGGSMKDAWVSVWRRDGDRLTYLGDSSTDATGAYRVSLLPTGEYLVEFSPEWGHGYIDEWYDDSPTDKTAMPVAVTDGATTSGIDAVLGKGADISGVVTGDDGRGLADVGVYLARYENGDWAYSLDGSTDALGQYRCSGIRAGDYKVEFFPFDGRHAPEFWDDQSSIEDGDLLSVVGGDVVTGVDAQLDIAGAIAGSVTGPTGAPLYGVEMTAYVLASGGQWVAVSAATADVHGEYEVSPLRPGTYRVGFHAYRGSYADEFWNDAAGPEAGQDVVVMGGETTSDIDVQMGTGETLSGTITDSAGRGIGDVSVAAYRSDGGRWTYVADVTTAANGSYAIRDLAPATYRVRVYESDWGTTRYLPEWYDDAASLAAATDVAVAAGAGAVVDEHLVHRADITGLTSATHSDQTMWYSARDAALAWSVADPALNGGYSYVLDQQAGTTTDKDIDSYTLAAEFAGLADGVWYFHVRGVAWWKDDEWNSAWQLAWGPTKRYVLHIDGTAPQTSDDADGLPHAADAVVTLVADDPLSGVASTWYSRDGGDWMQGNEVLIAAAADHTGDGLHTIAYYSVDAVGNAEEVRTCTVLIDTSAESLEPVGVEALGAPPDVSP